MSGSDNNDCESSESFKSTSTSLDSMNGQGTASANTLRAYKADWAHFSRWCRMRGTKPLRPSPDIVALYLAELAAPTDKGPSLSVQTILRRMSGLTWNAAQRGFVIDRHDPRIVSVLSAVRRGCVRPPVRKEAIQPDDLAAMVSTLPFDLRGMRDRTILLLGYAASLGRSEIVALDLLQERREKSGNWIEVLEDEIVIGLRSKTGWREVKVERSPEQQTCTVHAVQEWLHFSRIRSGPVFVRTSRDGKRVLQARLSDKHVARLIKATVLESGIRTDLSSADRLMLFSARSLSTRLSSSDGDQGDDI